MWVITVHIMFRDMQGIWGTENLPSFQIAAVSKTQAESIALDIVDAFRTMRNLPDSYRVQISALEVK